MEAVKGNHGLFTGFTSTVKKQGISAKDSIYLKTCLIIHSRDLEIFDTLQQESSTEQMSYATSVFFHFLGIIRCSNQNKKESETIRESNIIDTSLKFMRENLHKHLSLKNMAEHVNLSVSYFSRIFIAQIGTSPSKYLAQLRMEKACHYLEETEMKVNQISPLVGFDDPLYFSRLFTNYLKLSPTQYRENKNRTIYFRTTVQTSHHIMAV